MTSDQPTPASPPPSPADASSPHRAQFCTACGARLTERAQFCPSCGTPLGGQRAGGPGSAPPAPTVEIGGVTYELASFWRRVGASLIDSVAWSTATQVITVRMQPSMLPFGSTPSDEEAFDFLASFLPTAISTWAIVVALGAIVFIALEAYGWTPGKAALGLRVLRSDGRRPGAVHGAARHGGKFLSAIVFYLGYFWMLWDPERQTWHDKIASTYVVSVATQPAPAKATPGPLAISGGAWVWAVLTVSSIAAAVGGLLVLATMLPEDGARYREFFEGLEQRSGSTTQTYGAPMDGGAPRPLSITLPSESGPRIEVA